MAQYKRYIFIGAIILAALAAGGKLYGLAAPAVRLMTPERAPETVKQAVAALNERDEFQGKHFRVYTAHFNVYDRMPHLWERDENAVLWLGMGTGWNDEPQEWEKFGTIVVSQALQQAYLKNVLGVDSVFFPKGIPAGDYGRREQKREYFAIVGTPAHAEDALREAGIPYRKYSWNDTERLAADSAAITAAIADNFWAYKKNADFPPLMLRAAAEGIPLIGQWDGERSFDPLYLFNDNATFYMFKNDAATSIALAAADAPEIKKRAERARALVLRHFTADKIASALAEAMLNGEASAAPAAKGSLLLDLSTTVGHYGAGDYWIAKDLEHGFLAKGHLPSLSFGNSYYQEPAETRLLIRGALQAADFFNRDGSARVFYLMYPSKNAETNENIAEQLKKAMQPGDALATSSQRLAEEMQKGGMQAYYVPQFTNLERFYRDYDEKLKSEVLFIGNFHFYRHTPLLALKAGLPVTIYGDKWDKANVAVKGKYVDNRVLRKYYSSAKIVLNDTLPEMKKYGVISNRIMDATACGALVISDYMPEIEAVYGDSVPMYKNEKELEGLIRHYLENGRERQEKAARAQEITLKNFTLERAVQQLDKIIRQLKQMDSR